MPARPTALLALAIASALPLASRAAVAPAPAPATAPVVDPVADRFAAAAAAVERDLRTPRAIVALAQLAELEDELPELGRAVPVYARAADAPEALPEVRALARFRLAAVERASGNLQRSAAELRRLGFVAGWKVIGPFDDEGKRGFDAPYPPEKRIDLAARVPGKVGEVAWRDLPDDVRTMGFVPVGAALRPSREVVGYALAAVDAPRDERVVLWFGGSGAAKVFVNGALALSDSSHHPARLDQRGAAVTLRRGRNRILVKLCQQDGRMGFYLRLADARGEGRTLVAGDPARTPAAGPDPAPAAVEGVVAALSRRADAAARARGAGARRAEAEARYDLAVALAEKQPGEFQERRAAREARRAAELAPRWVEAQLLAASLDEDHPHRRARLEAALEAAPEHPRALLAIGRDELDQGRPYAAVRVLERAVAAAPAWPAARIALAEAHDRAGLEARAVREIEELAARAPTAPDAVRAAARLARRLGRLDDAALLLRKLLALRFDDAEARGGLAQLLLDRGDVDGAAALLAEGLRLDPGDALGRLRLADLLAANGRLEHADLHYGLALALAPDDADALERRGRAHLSAGRAKEALADLQRALELRPQNPALKELVRSLEPARERFERPYLLDARALAGAPASARPDDDAVVLGELKVTRVFPSGLSASFQQRVVKVLTARGADAERRQVIGYTPDRQEVRVERARILKPDGTTVETYDENERSASEPWYRLYYDTRTRTLSFPSLAPGDVLEVSWRVDDVAGENLLSDYFGEMTFVEDGTRKAHFDYVLLVPEARRIYSNAPVGVAHTERKLEGGVTEHRFSARDVPRIDAEPSMPGWSEVARYVHVSTYAGWDQVARFYWGLVKDQLRPNDDVRAAAEKIAAEVLRARGRPALRTASAAGGTVPELATPTTPGAGAPRWDRDTELALVRGVYDFVVSQTRYVGLEFGIHGFKPYRVDQILGRRFGDCKDKASLMHALLESLGIDSRLVLLRMRRLGKLPAAPASLAVFNHAILYVPGLDLWLDGTAAYSGSRDLPGEDRGATVLVVNPDGPPAFGYVPEASPGDNVTESRFDVVLAPDGSAVVKGSSRITGTQAPGYRRAYQAEGDRRATLEQAFNRTFPGLSVRSVRVSDLGRIEDDVGMEFTLEVPGYARRDGDALVFTPFGSGAGYAESLGALSARRYDLVIGDPLETRFTYRYKIPSRWSVAEMPEPARADTPFGAFEVAYRLEGDALVAEGHVTFKAGRVAATDYAAFRDLAARIDRAFGRKVRLVPHAAVEAAR